MQLMIETMLPGDYSDNLEYAVGCTLLEMQSCNQVIPPAIYQMTEEQTLDSRQRKEHTAKRLQMLQYVDKLVVYTDKGVCRGMQIVIEQAESLGIPIEYKTLIKD